MKKYKLLCLMFTSFSLITLLGSCDNKPSGGDDENPSDKPLHIVDPDGMGGEGILDDGGSINPTEPVEVAIGVETKGEHQIVIGKDKDKYETSNTDDTATWKNSDFTFNRIRHNTADQATTFTFDFSTLKDRSKVGAMVTLINNRTYTCIQVSVDKEKWTDIGYADKQYNGVKGDYTTHIDNLLGNQVTDTNLYQCYYKLGEYIGTSSIIYLRTTYSEAHYTKLPSPVGTDVIGYVSYFDELTVKYDYL